MEHVKLLLVSLLIVATSAAPSSQVATKSVAKVENEDYRLPNNTVPQHYEIKLIPYLDDSNYTFGGQVTVNVTVTAATSSIVFHAYMLDIDATSVLVLNGQNVTQTVSNQVYDEELHFYTLTFVNTLATGNYSISMSYVGQLTDSMYGFYRSYYNTSDGQTVWLASTQFEPVYARRAFPCFDEPALKAEFTISIAHWSNLTAISNADVASISDPDTSVGGRVWTNFEKTPLMSTYLVAFVVSDFEYLANAAGTFRVWSRPEALPTTNYAVTVGEQILNALNSLTQQNYSEILPKMDQIAIPDFSAGAMENWGIVTYRERLLLLADGISTTRNKQNVGTVIAHEFGHQWYGNLVSPLWWKYLWLNEGFATYYEYYATSLVETDWRLMDQFTVDNYHTSFLTDSLDTSHPINQDVYSPSEINAIFDLISYQKGGSIIRMMEHFLGHDVFVNGLQRYLQTMALQAATPDDLWDALDAVNNETTDGILQTHITVAGVMDTWTNQKGYPVVTVRRNYTTLTQEVSQERFLLKGSGSSNDTATYRWWVPINYVSQASPNFTSTAATDWIRPQDESIMISGIAIASHWIIFNVQQTGYYRVNYDDTNWNLITAYLETSEYTNIDVINRAQLINDGMNLARAGYLDYSVAIPITRYLKQETDYVPWAAAMSAFTYLNTMLAGSANYPTFQSYVLSLLTPVQETLTYGVLDSDEHVTGLLRGNIHSWACRMGSTECATQAEELLLQYYAAEDANESFIPADLKSWVYCEGLRNANVSVWNFLWGRYLATDNSGEQTVILTSLGCSQDSDILNRYLALSISANSGIRSQDTASVFNSVYQSSQSNLDVAFNFLVANYEEISAFYGGMNRIGTMLQGLGGRMVTSTQVNELIAFVEANSDQLGTAATSATQAIELAEENLLWLANYEADVIEALEAELDETSTDGANQISFSIIIAVITCIILVTH